MQNEQDYMPQKENQSVNRSCFIEFCKWTISL